jgi:hypothetical protein
MRRRRRPADRQDDSDWSAYQRTARLMPCRWLIALRLFHARSAPPQLLQPLAAAAGDSIRAPMSARDADTTECNQSAQSGSPGTLDAMSIVADRSGRGLPAPPGRSRLATRFDCGLRVNHRTCTHEPPAPAPPPDHRTRQRHSHSYGQRAGQWASGTILVQTELEITVLRLHASCSAWSRWLSMVGTTSCSRHRVPVHARHPLQAISLLAASIRCS